MAAWSGVQLFYMHPSLFSRVDCLNLSVFHIMSTLLQLLLQVGEETSSPIFIKEADTNGAQKADNDSTIHNFRVTDAQWLQLTRLLQASQQFRLQDCQREFAEV